MLIEQISIFIENREGCLAEVTAILRDANINIRALFLADTTDFGVLRLIVNDITKAKQTLENEGFTVGITKVLAVAIDNEPGGLNRVLDPLSDNEVNVEYMYAFANPQCKNSVMIFRFEDYDKALKIFKQQNINVITSQELAKL